jgi:hypothetical protein
MHIVWAFICACILVPRLTHASAKVAAGIYPLVTVLAIVVTGNHYIADALGAIPIVGIGWLLARRFTRAGRGAPAPDVLQPASPGRSSAAGGSA